jgi:Kef-type K+ transport system membrane component KefB
MSLLVSHTDPIAPVIFWVTLIFVFAILGRHLARSYGQPGVLGELLMGVIFGNVCYFAGIHLIDVLREGPVIYDVTKGLLQGESLAVAIGHSGVSNEASKQLYSALSAPSGPDYLKVAYILDIFSRYGVIFLLFLVGTESSLAELKQTGQAAFRVAMIGVLAPTVLGISVANQLLPALPFTTDLFIGATLSATSIGITARVLKELNQMRTREARTILGAAMIDDILGLFILAVVSGIVVNGRVDLYQIAQIALSSLLFFVAAIAFGPWLLKKIIVSLDYFEAREAKLIGSFIFLMMFAWLATLLNLAAIIGAFSAGLIIHDEYFEKGKKKQTSTIHELLSPLESILAPLFFMLIGIQIKFETLLDKQVLLISAALVLAATAGKLISGFVAGRKDDRLLIGVGMIPRGEVGLVFASIGKTIGVFNDQIFSAVVIMVIVTTIITPPLMKWRISRLERKL